MCCVLKSIQQNILGLQGPQVLETGSCFQFAGLEATASWGDTTTTQIDLRAAWRAVVYVDGGAVEPLLERFDLSTLAASSTRRSPTPSQNGGHHRCDESSFDLCAHYQARGATGASSQRSLSRLPNRLGP